jgi:CRP/FNR family transcriptional regulator
MSKIIETIASIPGFSTLEPDMLDQVRAIAAVRRVVKGELIFAEGVRGEGFYAVVEGLVKIYKLSPEGKEQVLHLFGPGEPFGQVAVFAGRAYPANAEALEDGRLLFFPREAFAGLIRRNPALAMRMLAVLSLRLREFTQQIENLTLKEVPGRLASYLLYLAEEQKQADAVALPVTKGQLASLLGTIPETLSRILTRLASGGLIEVQGRRILLRDRQRLSHLARTGRWEH